MLNLFAVTLVYVGFVLSAAGAVSMIKPLRFVGMTTRGTAALALTAGVCLSLAGVFVPAPLERVDGAATELDRAMPAWQFRERHQTHVDASAERVYDAVMTVTADEILLFRTLTWIRQPRLRAPARENILAPTGDKPILDVAVHSGFRRLAEIPGREIVLGTRVGRAFATINFLVEPAGPHAAEVTTETRVVAPDIGARRGFAAYWRVIYPGSALIRRMWLRGIKRRAESRAGQVGQVGLVLPGLPDRPSQ